MMDIDYIPLSLTIPERVQFRNTLDARDAERRNRGIRRRVSGDDLAPGMQRLQVVVSPNDWVWQEGGVSRNLREAPALCHTARVFAVAVMSRLGLIWSRATTTMLRRQRLTPAPPESQFAAARAERTRIAQELHDTVMQGFAGVALMLKAARLALPEQPDVAAETLVQAERLAGQALREARESVWDMRGTELDERDLTAALEESARVATGGGLQVTVRSRGARRRLARATEVAAVRIAREALANAVKHAGARRIEIGIEFRPATLTLQVRDDGCGFTAVRRDQAIRSGHFGISGMRDRARNAGGTCQVRSHPGGGTIVSLELPLGQAISNTSIGREASGVVGR